MTRFAGNERRYLAAEAEKEKYRRMYRRNFILMILSLVAAFLALLLPRFWEPASEDLSTSPEAKNLKAALEKTMPDDEFRVRFDREEVPPTIEIEATSSEGAKEPESYIARLQSIINDEVRLYRAIVVIRLYERWRADPEEPLVSIKVKRTTLEEIRKQFKH